MCLYAAGACPLHRPGAAASLSCRFGIFRLRVNSSRLLLIWLQRSAHRAGVCAYRTLQFQSRGACTAAGFTSTRCSPLHGLAAAQGSGGMRASRPTVARVGVTVRGAARLPLTVGADSISARNVCGSAGRADIESAPTKVAITHGSRFSMWPSV